MKKSILVTGGAGFIGSTLIKHLLQETNYSIVNLDLLTYAGNLNSLNIVGESPRYHFIQGDIADRAFVDQVLETHRPWAIMNLAAESHVDRSIDGPSSFIQTNIVGTFSLLEAALAYWKKRGGDFRFHHISTDEVFGSLGTEGYFTETSPYDPSSPYSASKAASDHLIRAWHRTYGLPVLLTNCSNNYGPHQYPEKLIPLIIRNALAGLGLPVYGDGRQIRDWLFVEDHVKALRLVLETGRIGETYNIGGDSEVSNIDIVRRICRLLDEKFPESVNVPHENLIAFVADRPGHDRRYAIDCRKIKNDLGWRQEETLASGLEKTVDWYIANSDWVENSLANKYAGERLGTRV